MIAVSVCLSHRCLSGMPTLWVAAFTAGRVMSVAEESSSHTSEPLLNDEMAVTSYIFMRLNFFSIVLFIISRRFSVMQCILQCPKFNAVL